MMNDQVAHEAQVVDLLTEMVASMSVEQAPLMKPVRRMMKRLQRIRSKARQISRERDRQASRARKGIVAGLAILTFASASHAAPAPSYAQEACAEVRAANPTYTMPIHFACIQPVAHGSGSSQWFSTKVTHFYCPEITGSKLHKIVDMVDWPTNPTRCDDPNAPMH